MNKGILNQSLLEKNIEKINYYSSEEKKFLNKIYNKYNELPLKYESTNSDLLIEKNNKLNEDINSINNKRIKYTNILNKAILQYNGLLEESHQILVNPDNKEG